MKKVFLFGGLFFFVAIFCRDARTFFHLGVDEGLSQGSIFDMVQDEKGFIWIATADGLNRFDGYDFRIFNSDPEDSLAEFPVHMRGMYLSGNTLWISTSTSMDLFRMDLTTYKMKKVYTCPDSSMAKHTMAFHDDRDTVWILAPTLGVIKINWRTGEELERHPEAQKSFPAPNVVRYDSATHTLWYTEIFHAGLNSYNIRTGEFRHRELRLPEQLSKLDVSSIIVEKDRSIWLGSDNSIIHYYPERDTFDVFYNNLHDEQTDYVVEFTHGAENDLWCGTSLGFVYQFDKSKGAFTEKYSALENGGNIRHRIISLIMDHSRNVWIGTDPDGLYKIDTKEKPFHHTQHNPLAAGSLRNNFIKCFFEKDSEMYIGLYQHCISVANMNTGAHRYINTFQNSTANLPVVGGITKDPAGNIWCATGSGIAYVEPGGTFLKRPKIEPQNPVAKSFSISIFTKDDSTLYVGCDTTMYVLHLHGLEGTIENVPVIKSIVEEFCIDHNGNLWVGATHGLYYSKGGNPQDLKLVLADKGRVKCILEARDQSLWIGTENGLFRIDPISQSLMESYSEADGMPNNFVYGILEDDEGKLWASTNKGLSAFDRTTKTFRNYSVTDGLQSNEFNTGAFLKASNGDLYFGGVNGYNYFTPSEIADNPFAPQCAITGFSIFDKPYVSDTAIESRKNIVLDYTQNNLLLAYTALEFSDPQKNRFRYRMYGLDTNWIEAGKERTARFVNLDPGDYVFQLTACNNDGVWNSVPLELRISITPPFWKTIPFIVGASVMALLLIVLSVRYYFRRRLVQKTRELELKQSVRMTAVFETEENERKRIAGELHDGIGQLLSTARLNVSGMGENLDPKLSVLYKNSIQLLDQACEEVRTISHNMMPGALIRMGLIVAVNELIIKINDAEKIKVDFDTEIDERFEEATEITLYRVIQEALNNMVKHSQAKNILVKMWRDGNALHVTIADDGTGFDVAKIQESKGLGWKNMYSRVESLKGTMKVESESGKGTTINIQVPL